jgi:hypothetical protein
MRMNRGDIITQALQRVGNTTNQLRIQARIRLNRILQDLYLQWDWPFLWRTASVTIAPDGRFALPVGFLKCEDDQALTLAGRPLQELDHLTYAQLARAGVVATQPRIWTIDYAEQVGHVWPSPAAGAGATLRHKILPPDVAVDPPSTYDADIPTFPWDTYLTDAVLQWAMEYEVDPRANDQLLKNREQLGLIRGATWPERSYRPTIPLDPTVFTTPWRGE